MYTYDPPKVGVYAPRPARLGLLTMLPPPSGPLTHGGSTSSIPKLIDARVESATRKVIATLQRVSSLSGPASTEQIVRAGNLAAGFFWFGLPCFIVAVVVLCRCIARRARACCRTKPHNKRKKGSSAGRKGKPLPLGRRGKQKYDYLGPNDDDDDASMLSCYSVDMTSILSSATPIQFGGTSSSGTGDKGLSTIPTRPGSKNQSRVPHKLITVKDHSDKGTAPKRASSWHPLDHCGEPPQTPFAVSLQEAKKRFLESNAAAHSRSATARAPRHDWGPSTATAPTHSATPTIRSQLPTGLWRGRESKVSSEARQAQSDLGFSSSVKYTL